MSEALTLDAASIEAVAQRVAELLGTRQEHELIDAQAVADRFSVSRDWVYEHATDLGAIRLGDGPRARLRFDPERVAEALAPRPFAAAPPPPRRKRPSSAPVELLPIGGRR